MRRDLLKAAKVLALPTLALALVAMSLPGRIDLATRVYALLVAAAALWLGLSALRRAYPRETPLRPRAGRRGNERPLPPPTLVRLEQACALGLTRSFDLHLRIRPRLREIAATLLATRRGVSLDGNPDAARRLLGNEAWELVRADRPVPENRLGPGIPAATLRRVVQRLESL